MKKEKSHVELSTLEIKMPGQELLKHIYEHGQSAPYDITDVVAKSIIEHFLRTNEVLTLTYIDGKEYVLNIERVEDNKEPEPKKVYLSGPITSLPLEDARRIFESAEEFIAKLGYIAVNPMKNGLSPESTWEEHMKKDLAMLLECDTICLLPNFRESKGAMLELDVAIALGMSALRYTPAFWYNASLAEKHLNDTIEEPSRTLSQIMSDNLSNITKMVKEIGEENSEGIRILTGISPDKPASNVITNRPYIHPSLLGERTEPTPYAKIQRRADFLSNFKDGWDLFNSNALFRSITMLVMNGASEYDLMLELIFMIDGHTASDTSHLKPFHKQKPTGNETE